MNRRSMLPKLTVCTLAIVAITLLVSGCSSPLSAPAPSVTISATYVVPSPTPIPVASPTPIPQPSTTWNGLYVNLNGNVSASGDHVMGTITVSYLDKNFWDDHPLARYDTDEGGAYSLDVRANVPFKMTVGYLYVGRLPQDMNTKLLDQTYNIQNDTRMDLT